MSVVRCVTGRASLAIHEIAAADAFEQRRGGQQDRGGGSLLGCLPPLRRSLHPSGVALEVGRQPSFVCCSGKAMALVLLTSTWSGPSHPATNAAMDARSARSSLATRMARFPVLAVISAVTCAPPRCCVPPG